MNAEEREQREAERAEEYRANRAEVQEHARWIADNWAYLHDYERFQIIRYTLDGWQ